MLVCDGLKGLPDSVSTVWDRTIVQTCVVHYPETTIMPIPGGVALVNGGGRGRRIGIITALRGRRAGGREPDSGRLCASRSSSVEGSLLEFHVRALWRSQILQLSEYLPASAAKSDDAELVALGIGHHDVVGDAVHDV